LERTLFKLLAGPANFYELCFNVLIYFAPEPEPKLYSSSGSGQKFRLLAAPAPLHWLNICKLIMHDVGIHRLGVLSVDVHSVGMHNVGVSGMGLLKQSLPAVV
jgi:hypothetical protein